jgi:hypothetical protein
MDPVYNIERLQEPLNTETKMEMTMEPKKDSRRPVSEEAEKMHQHLSNLLHNDPIFAEAAHKYAADAAKIKPNENVDDNDYYWCAYNEYMIGMLAFTMGQWNAALLYRID